ncbi:MAG TPA: ABC transporter permease [Terracidiphilus sp.]|nr:ABC transporter permease [Terracidiphilus sp.]
MGLMQLFARRRIYRDLADEIRQHIEEKTEALMAEGMSREEAQRAARREFGNVTRIEERGREAWMWPLAESLWADVRFAFRQLTRNSGFALTVILTLALGIGATTAIFSLVNAVLLRPLPFPESDRLMWLKMQDHSVPGVVPESLSYPDYFDWRAQNTTFSGIATYRGGGDTLQLHGASDRIDTQTVSANFFTVLGIAPFLGRNFTWEDEKAGHRAVVLSYELWQSQFSSNRDIAGTSIQLDGKSYTVAGVMPAEFQFPFAEVPPQAWLSLAVDEENKTASQRGFDVLNAMGRLKPGVTVEHAQADLSRIAANLAQAYPDSNKQLYSALVQPELQQLTGDTRPALRVLFGAVMLVLLIVCANVAGLLLARYSRRGAEFALRSAIGASRAALIRQLLVESITLSLCGGLAGIALAFGLVRTAINLMPAGIPRIDQASVDGRVLLFDIGLSLAAGIFFGLLPALRSSRSAPANVLREGSRSLAGSQSSHRLHNAMVVAQTAIGLILLISSGLLIRSFVRILNVDPGFDARNVLTARAAVRAVDGHSDQMVQFYRELSHRIAALPGVQSAALGWPLPMSNSQASISFNIQGRPIARGDEPSEAMGLAMPGYFATMRIPLIAGRDFRAQDDHKAPPVIIVNQAFAQKYFPSQNPVGQHIQVRLGDGVLDSPIREVVAVVGNTKEKGLSAAPAPLYYLPFAQAVITNPYIIVRAQGDPMLLENSIRGAVHEMDQSVPVYQVLPLSDYLSKSAAQPRFQTFVLTCFAAIALILAAIGLYGLLSYMVVQRTLEIGLRMALGARRSDVLGMMLRHGLGFAAAGIVVGVIASAAVTRLLSGMLYGIHPSDPITFAVTSALLLLVSAGASIVPAYRAARLDPMATLREQ